VDAAAVHLDAMRCLESIAERRYGFGVVESDDTSGSPVGLQGHGGDPAEEDKNHFRTSKQVFHELTSELERWQPDAVAIEEFSIQ